MSLTWAGTPQDAHNLLRPETVESLFVLWRVTGEERYREWGWHMFRAWHRFCRVPTGGFANLESVLTVRSQHWPYRSLPFHCCAVTNLLDGE